MKREVTTKNGFSGWRLKIEKQERDQIGKRIFEIPDSCFPRNDEYKIKTRKEQRELYR